jgi:allantoicase
LGNHPPHASIEAVNLSGKDILTDWDAISWTEILNRTSMRARRIFTNAIRMKYSRICACTFIPTAA